MKHNFEERKNNRIEHARQQAAKNKDEASRLFKKSDDMASVIPPGQPILIGHHSEKGDRRYREKVRNTFAKGMEHSDKAEYYADKAESIENNNAIFSDDPEALDKLKKKAAFLKDLQAFMKNANRLIKKQDKEGFLKLPYGTEALWQELNNPPHWREKGFPSYRLANNNANIRRIEQRIAGLERLATRTTKEITGAGVRLVENAEAGRVQFIFDDKPSEEVRKVLKQNGFRWCPSEQAWQRHLNNAGIYAAKSVMQQLTATQNT